MNESCLQEKYAPHNECFGCGPANKKGLRIRSFPRGEELVAEWTPEAHHEAFPGMLNGGIIGSLLDCHCNWTASWYLMNQTGANTAPCTVTAAYSIRLLRPTPSKGPVSLRAWVVESEGNKVVVDGELIVDGTVCDTCRGTFVAVTEGHPAYHRW